MTDTTTLIQRLRLMSPDLIGGEAADALEQQAAELDALKRDIESLLPDLTAANVEIEQQAAQIEALRADAERWRHVRDGFSVMGLNIDGMHSWTWRGYHKIGKGANIDEAVDAALRQEQKA